MNLSLPSPLPLAKKSSTVTNFNNFSREQVGTTPQNSMGTNSLVARENEECFTMVSWHFKRIQKSERISDFNKECN